MVFTEKTGKTCGENLSVICRDMPKWGTGQTRRPARRSRAVHWRPQPHTTREPPSWGDAGKGVTESPGAPIL